MKIRGILIDVENGTIERKTIDYNDYTDITRACLCTYITCVTRDFNGVIADVYCDDEILLTKSEQELKVAITSYMNNRPCEQLFGNCFLCSHKKNGDMRSLFKREIDHILTTCKAPSGKSLVCNL